MKHYFKGYTLIIILCFIALNSIAQNVGIGTINPEYPLTVRVSGQGIAQDDADSITSIGFYVVGHYAYLQTNTKDNLYFATHNGPPFMTLDTLGSLGIGTILPTAKLDVNGSVRLRIGTPTAGQVLTTDAQGNATWQASTIATGVQYSMAGANHSIPYINNATRSSDTLSFTSRYYDAGSLFDGTYYTVPVNGLYHFDVNVYWSLASLSSPYSVYISLSNNSFIAQTITPVPANYGGNITSSLSTNLFLTAGQKVHVELTQNASNAASISAWSGAFTSFSAYKVN